MRRRTFLRVGLAGSALLAAAGGAALLLRRAAPDAASIDDTRIVLRAVMPAFLAGALPSDEAARTRALEAGLQRTLATIAGLPPSTRAELGELFVLLASAPGRWLAGVDRWEAANVDQVSAFLQRWRTHSFDLFEAGYHAMHDLVLGPYYADRSTWDAIGYPGPIRI
ncbi:MAG: hypothetical protein ACM3PU_15770 [Gemmatimonadota bacterium]